MAKTELYLNESLTTEQLMDATGELAMRGLGVAIDCAAKLSALARELRLDPDTQARILFKAIDYSGLPIKMRRRWNRDEVWVSRFLNQVNLLPEGYRSAEEMRTRMGDGLLIVPTQESLSSFLAGKRGDFHAVLSPELRKAQGTLYCARVAYCASRVMRYLMAHASAYN